MEKMILFKKKGSIKIVPRGRMLDEFCILRIMNLFTRKKCTGEWNISWINISVVFFTEISDMVLHFVIMFFDLIDWLFIYSHKPF